MITCDFSRKHDIVLDKSFMNNLRPETKAKDKSNIKYQLMSTSTRGKDNISGAWISMQPEVNILASLACSFNTLIMHNFNLFVEKEIQETRCQGNLHVLMIRLIISVSRISELQNAFIKYSNAIPKPLSKHQLSLQQQQR